MNDSLPPSSEDTAPPVERFAGRLGCALGLCLLLGLLFVYIGIAVVFTQRSSFYSDFIFPLFPLLMLLLLLQVFWRRGRRLIWWVIGFLVMAGVGTAAVYEYRLVVDARIPVIAAEEPNLRRFQPFAPDNDLVILAGESRLRLEEDLPRLDGATALYPVYAAMVEAVYPAGSYPPNQSVVRMSKTGTAYDRLIAGETDVIFVARPSADHKAKAAAAGVTLHLTAIGHEAFVFYVNAHNPVSDLRQEQIRGIYSGAITNWQTVGGPDLIIRAFQRPENSGSQTMLQHIMGDYPLMDPPQRQVVMGMGGIIARTADYKNYPDAIGYSFRYFATTMIKNGAIHLLSIDGVAPTRAAIADGSYPFTTDIYAVTTRPADPAISALLEWIVGDQGQYILGQTGYVPLRRSESDSTATGAAP